MARPFTKPAESIQQQLARLRSRGLVIADQALAEHALNNISYYRLRAYWHYFETNPLDPNHPLRIGTTLEEVLALYDFDRRLRLLMLDGIERIEVAAWGSWAHYMAMTYGPHGYLTPSLYSNQVQFQKNKQSLQREMDRSHDTFIAHYKATYDNPTLPPVWMAAEIMSFGLLSKWQGLLRQMKDKKAIAAAFKLGPMVYTAFLHHLTYVRNVCAHHSRLWNRQVTVTPTLPTQPPALANSLNLAASRQIYNTLTMMAFVMEVVAPASRWKEKMVALLERNPTGDFLAMGSLPDWKTRPVWVISIRGAAPAGFTFRDE